jgi:hypothetical protein
MFGEVLATGVASAISAAQRIARAQSPVALMVML